MPNFDQVLINIQTVIPSFVSLLMVISFVCGVYFIMRGLMMLKVFGMPLTQMSRPGELGGPLLHMFVGAILMYIPTTVDVFHATIFGVGDTYIQGNRAAEIIHGYTGSTTIDEKWATLKGVVLKYVNFIGFIAFVRGWFIIAKAGNPGVQPGTISKGLTHLVAGIIAINIQGFIEILYNTVLGR